MSSRTDPLPEDGENVNVSDESEPKVDTTEAWETVLETLKQQDKELTDNWKDELNNLLIFAGLFSAVVTAFTVESYTWLQQDPADMSNQLLERISMQLANSTIPALPLQQVASSFDPGPVAVPVNVLWVLSLTLSLLSAFFAIAVQQWLRHLRLPPDVPIRRAVQLRQLRYEGLQTWQVPGIVALLPLLLQIAVIFFLVGLLVLLRSLDGTVTTAFTVVAVSGILIFLATTVIPLINITCPYKSPVVPTVLIVLQWFSYPVALILTAITTLLVSIGNTHLIFSYMMHHSTVYIAYLLYLENQHRHLRSYVMFFGTHMFIDISQFWFLRELRVALNPHETPLDCGALAATLLSVSSRTFGQISCCLRDFTPSEREAAALQSILRSYRAPRSPYNDVNFILTSRFITSCQFWLSPRHYDFIVEALPRKWSKHGKASWDHALLLCFLQQIHKAFGLQCPSLFRVLLDTANRQVIPEFRLLKDIIPAYLLCDRVGRSDYILDEEETSLALAVALKSLESVRNVPDSDFVQGHLASSAVALISWTHHIKPCKAGGILLLWKLVNFFEGDNGGVKVCIQSWTRITRDNPGQFPLYTVSNGIRLICKSILDLAERNAAPLGPNCSLASLAQHMGDVCQEEGDDFVAARQYLDSFTILHAKAQYEVPDPGPMMASLVRAERRLMKPTVCPPEVDKLKICEETVDLERSV